MRRTSASWAMVALTCSACTLGAAEHARSPGVVPAGAEGISAEAALTQMPPHPSRLQARGVPGAVELQWAPPLPLPAGITPGYDPRVDHYAVLRRREPGRFEKLGVTQATAYRDATAQPGVPYNYVVIAVQVDGAESNFSDEVTAVAGSQD